MIWSKSAALVFTIFAFVSVTYSTGAHSGFLDRSCVKITMVEGDADWTLYPINGDGVHLNLSNRDIGQSTELRPAPESVGFEIEGSGERRYEQHRHEGNLIRFEDHDDDDYSDAVIRHEACASSPAPRPASPPTSTSTRTPTPTPSPTPTPTASPAPQPTPTRVSPPVVRSQPSQPVYQYVLVPTNTPTAALRPTRTPTPSPFGVAGVSV